MFRRESREIVIYTKNISTLNNHSSGSADGIISNMIKKSKHTMLPLFLNLVNTSVKKTKTSKIIPKWKTTKAQTCFDNLRPINIISVLCQNRMRIQSNGICFDSVIV